MAAPRRIRAIVAYDGTGYHGWQIQNPALPTVQAELERVVAVIEGKPVHVAGSGRTDAGVHARGQVAAFTLDNPIPCWNLRKAINRLLPPDIRVMEVEETHLEFHPRFDSFAKTYEYRILRSEICHPFDLRWVHHHPFALDEAAMIEAAPEIEGKHDFAAFAARDERYGNGVTTIRTIYSSSLMREGGLLIYRVRGNGFLKHMVRNIVGVLLQVGQGNISTPQLRARLLPNSGIPSGPTAPACGLCLISVEYPVSPEPPKTSQ